jgi:hypothetical protein
VVGELDARNKELEDQRRLTEEAKANGSEQERNLKALEREQVFVLTMCSFVFL